MEKIVEKTSHAVADLYQINKRGYIREGYFADLVLIDLNDKQKVSKDNLHYKCNWSPFEGHEFAIFREASETSPLDTKTTRKKTFSVFEF